MLAPPSAAKVLVVVAACVGVLAGAPAAHARWTFELGIGEQGVEMFSDPRFGALGLEHVRVVARTRPLVAFVSSWRSYRRLPPYRT